MEREVEEGTVDLEVLLDVRGEREEGERVAEESDLREERRQEWECEPAQVILLEWEFESLLGRRGYCEDQPGAGWCDGLARINFERLER